MKTQIVPFNYDNDMESIMRKDNCQVVGIEEMQITYTQLPDTNSCSDEYQHLIVTTRMSCSVGEKEATEQQGFYFDITIPEGEHWSVEDGDEIKDIINDFKSRLYKTTKRK